jgi:ABC-2 type transport system ATP-binding protein
MCDRVLVLEKGHLAFDGATDEGIKFLHYDEDEDDVNSEEEGDDQDDDELGADV